MVANPHTRWCVVAPDALVLREWDGEMAVFNQSTGHTHLLSELGSEVLRFMIEAKGPTTIAAIATALSDDPAAGDASDWTQAVSEVLSGFARLGLAQTDKS